MGQIEVITNKIVKAHYDYLKECEKQSTDIQKYTAEIITATKELSAIRETAAVYYKNHFEEKQILYNSANELLDTAIKSGNSEIADIALKTIEIVHKRTPFGR